MERMYDQRYRQRIERQIRIVKPEATAEEVEDIIDSDNSSQVFTQSVSRGFETPVGVESGVLLFFSILVNASRSIQPSPCGAQWSPGQTPRHQANRKDDCGK